MIELNIAVLHSFQVYYQLWWNDCWRDKLNILRLWVLAHNAWRVVLVVMPKHNGQLILCMHTCLRSRQILIDSLLAINLVPSLYPPRKPMSPLWTITVPQKVLWHTSRLRYNHIYCCSLKSMCTQPAPTNACINRPKLVVGVQLTGCGLSLQFLAVSLLSSTRYARAHNNILTIW